MALLDDIAEKKRLLDSMRPLPLHVVHDLADWFELELTAAGLRVEQAALTLPEIKTLFERGVVLRHRSPAEQRMALNHKGALELMARLSYQPAGVVTERTVAAFHTVLFQGIDEDAGKYREGPLKGDNSGTSPDPAKVRVSMSALSGWLKRTEPSPETAFEAHHRMMSVRPFFDGNAATALLLCNLVLNRAGYPPVVVPAEEADLFATLVERAWSVGDKTPFREQMMRFLDQSLDVCLAGAAKGQSDPDDIMEIDENA